MMKENGAKRREWIKTAAIIFLSVLLVLTFFSNTIMNYSLPEVAAQYVQSGSITSKIRGTGVVESGALRDVVYEKSQRTIESITVREGDVVEKGDVLFVLTDEEDPELVTALNELEEAKENYENVLKSRELAFLMGEFGTISDDLYNYIITGAETSFVDFKNQLMQADAKIAEYTALVNQYQALSQNPGNPNTTAEDKAIADAQAVCEQKENNLNAVKAELESSKDAYDIAKSNVDKVLNGELIVDETTEYNQLQYTNDLTLVETYESKNATIPSLEAEIVAAQKVLAQCEQAKVNKINNHINSINNELAKQEKNKANAEKNRQDIMDKIKYVYGGETYDLEEPYKRITEAQKKVDELREQSKDATIKAPISGTIVSLPVRAGSVTTDEYGTAVVLASIQPEGQGYIMSFSVTNEQAKRVAVGDRAELVNSWYYNDLEIILKSIKTDKTDPSKRKVLNFTVQGDVIAGQSLNVSVGQKSADYEMIVPNSAIREDNNGKFILIVETKSSPLGNRYVATRVDVQVVASDDTKSAITGALYGWEFVITTSTKPVEAGQLVRLADN